MAGIAPFLILKPAYEYWKKKKITQESIFSLVLLVLLVLAGIGVILYRGIDVSEGNIGVIGIYSSEEILDFPLFSEYVIFLIPVFIGLSRLKQRHLQLFVPWLIVTLLLILPLFSKPGWGFRFGWNAYVPIALLSALGVGFFRKQKILFCGIITILGIFTLGGFVTSGLNIHPIIYEDEWEGFLALHESRPDIVLTGAGGGMRHWVEAAGFEFVADPSLGSHLLACDHSEHAPNGWLGGSCAMSTLYEEGMERWAEERVGRFYLVRNEELTEEDEFLNEDWDN
jgi:hypothetical protein